jgi:hypothetical protein
VIAVWRQFPRCSISAGPPSIFNYRRIFM